MKVKLFLKLRECLCESFGRYVDFRKQLPLKCILAQDKRKQDQQLFYFPNGAKFACFRGISRTMARKTKRKQNVVASSRILSAEATKKWVALLATGCRLSRPKTSTCHLVLWLWGKFCYYFLHFPQNLDWKSIDSMKKQQINPNFSLARHKLRFPQYWVSRRLLKHNRRW